MNLYQLALQKSQNRWMRTESAQISVLVIAKTQAHVSVPVTLYSELKDEEKHDKGHEH